MSPDGKNREALEKLDLLRAAHIRQPLDIRGQPRRGETRFQRVDIPRVSLGHRTSAAQLEFLHTFAAFQRDECFHEEADSLRGDEAREIADDRFGRRGGRGLRIVFERDAIRHDANATGAFLRAPAKPAGHQVGKVSARSDPQVRVAHPLGKQLPHALAPRGAQAIDEGVLALQESDHRHSEFGLEPPREPGLEGGGKPQRFRLRMLAQPGDEFLDFRAWLPCSPRSIDRVISATSGPPVLPAALPATRRNNARWESRRSSQRGMRRSHGTFSRRYVLTPPKKSAARDSRLPHPG